MKLRAGRQSEGREGAGVSDPADPARHRRRGDRIVEVLLRLLTAGVGTNRKCQSASTTSARGGNPDGICSLRAEPGTR